MVLAAPQAPTRPSLAMVRCGLKLSQTIAILIWGGQGERR